MPSRSGRRASVDPPGRPTKGCRLNSTGTAVILAGAEASRPVIKIDAGLSSGLTPCTRETVNMLGTRLTSEDIAARIREAGKTCLLIAPGVDAIVAEALLERAQRMAEKASLVIDGSHHAERSGYGETDTWRKLMKETELRVMPGTRLGVLVTCRGAWLFAPRAGKLDPRDEAGLSAVALATHHEAALSLCERILGRGNDPFAEETSPPVGLHEPPRADGTDDAVEPRARTGTITEAEVERVERAIKEHPPRDYAKEREITVYTAFVGYIELHLVGSSLATGARLRIPKELVERGFGENELRTRINESVRIDLDEEVDTGVRAINERLNAIRTLYTRQLSKPHGRIYRKRQRQELDRHFEDLNREIDQANAVLEQKIEMAVSKQLDDLAESYSRQAAPDALPKLTKDDISRMLFEAWNEAGAARPRKVTLEVTFKELTWETLQSDALKDRILQQFPDLENSALYRDSPAHTPPSETPG